MTKLDCFKNFDHFPSRSAVNRIIYRHSLFAFLSLINKAVGYYLNFTVKFRFYISLVIEEVISWVHLFHWHIL